MSRSRKKHPFRGITTTESEKQEKRVYKRRYRHACKQAVNTDLERDVFPHLREYSNPWSMGKDGKVRFDPLRYPQFLRK